VTKTASDRRQQILALEPRLLDCADALTRDPSEARALLHETLTIANDPAYGSAEVVGPEVWVFRLMRQRFYSVERDRDYRRSRSAAVTELGYARKRALLAQAEAAPDYDQLVKG
jgi:DNA-directed RNA polymerase specialized sigma24 family protein